jgi:O-antigen ligase
MLNDLATIVVVEISGFKLYVADIILCFVMMIFFFNYLYSWRKRKFSLLEKVYTLFLFYLLVQLIIGFQIYGFRAIGEFRSASYFFLFCIPAYLLENTEPIDEKLVLDIVAKTLLLSASAAFIMFVIEMSIGERFYISQINRELFTNFSDFRGMRILDSYQTFNLLAISLYFILKYEIYNVINKKEILFSIIAIVSVIITRNRASLFALLTSFFLFLAFNRRIRILLMFMSISIAVIFAIYMLSPNLSEQIINAFQMGLKPEEDPTGKWRLAVQGVALAQGLLTPYFGQSYGGYFKFDVPGMGFMDITPHNQFLSLFLKTGGLGVGLLITIFIIYLVKYIKAIKLTIDKKARHILIILFIIVFSQLIYGFSYDFVPFFSLYLGFSSFIIEKTCKSTNFSEKH